MRLIDADRVLFEFNEQATEHISEDAELLYSLILNAPEEPHINTRNGLDNPIENDGRRVSINMFDIEEIIPNCTVQIWKNSVTGEISVGWFRNK